MNTVEKPVCLECGKELIKRKYESKARFANKKFCSSKCSRTYLKKNHLGWWKYDILAARPYSRDDENALEALDDFKL